ncbi:ferric reductase like transmembrane component-domain-containing protein [Syncephalastrum racemosum]|uniref:Ferric reductase like transmembrane component-domain-containing protein n=1 Tax=Syncephalastrum racemosum TaxID=13706 RepID=A0A1X2H507_SYNRA|nr:ferric reductase like transmembrane component-domain-containing protein [Syncephalastrum racemosum]
MPGYSYAFFCWGFFALYCIGHQIGRLLRFLARRELLLGKSGTATKLHHRYSRIGLPAFMEHVIRIPFVTSMIPIKHIIGVFVLMCLNVLFCFFGAWKYDIGITSFPTPDISYYDLRGAYLGMVNWGFVFVLGSRNTIVTRMSGMTFESLIPFHRWLARIGFCEFVPHFVWRLYMGWFYTMNPKDTLFADFVQGTGTVAMIGFLILFVTSFEWIRRGFFEVFYYMHILGIFVAIIAACWHRPACVAYFMPPVGLWVFDRCWRSYQSWLCKVNTLSVEPAINHKDHASENPGITRVLFEYSRLHRYHPGQYVFVSLVKRSRSFWDYFSYLNWHPMTISEAFGEQNDSSSVAEERIVNGITIHEEKTSTDIEETLGVRRRHVALGSRKTAASLHIKALGRYTKAFTEDMNVRVDGPYGPRLEFQDYAVVICFAAGIGITPALTIIKDAVERRAAGIQTVRTEQMHLIWAVRSLDELDPFVDLFTYLSEQYMSPKQPLHLHVQVFVTRAEQKHLYNEGDHWIANLNGFNFAFGSRPNIPTCMQAIEDGMQGIPHEDVWVHTCGSDQFMSGVLNQAFKRHWHAHHETFEF